MKSEKYLFISDLQEPFGAENAFKFVRYVKKHFNIPNHGLYNVGDEVDQYFAGAWDKDPDARHTPNSEIKDTVERLRPWYAEFPDMKLCLSNHGSRWQRRASAAQIPSQMMRLYQEVIEAPEGWKWQKYWTIDPGENSPIRVEHGDDWGGSTPHLQAALHNGISTVMGHHHSKAGVEHFATATKRLWGMVTGCLIDFDSYAFHYARNAKFKPVLGVGIVLDNGKLPIWIPYE